MAIVVLVSPFDDPVAALTRVRVNVGLDFALPSCSSNFEGGKRVGSTQVTHSHSRGRKSGVNPEFGET